MNKKMSVFKYSINAHLCGAGGAWKLKQVLAAVPAEFMDIRNQFR